jgi:hypothetical protein
VQSHGGNRDRYEPRRLFGDVTIRRIGIARGMTVLTYQPNRSPVLFLEPLHSLLVNGLSALWVETEKVLTFNKALGFANLECECNRMLGQNGKCAMGTAHEYHNQEAYLPSRVFLLQQEHFVRSRVPSSVEQDQSGVGRCGDSCVRVARFARAERATDQTKRLGALHALDQYRDQCDARHRQNAIASAQVRAKGQTHNGAVGLGPSDDEVSDLDRHAVDFNRRRQDPSPLFFSGG